MNAYFRRKRVPFARQIKYNYLLKKNLFTLVIALMAFAAGMQSADNRTNFPEVEATSPRTTPRA